MRKSLSLIAFVVLGAAMMYGQASRTWVSGVGDDANPCSRTAPCKTFAGAISKTALGGEIDALDPAGFGALTITKAITIDGSGTFASVLVAGTNGIVVQAGANDTVAIRGLSINGISGSGNGGLNGIRFLSGKELNVVNCYIQNFNNNGIDVAVGADNEKVFVKGTVVKNCAGDGIAVTTSVGTVRAAIVDSAFVENANGLHGKANSRVSADRCSFYNGGNGVFSDGTGGTAVVDVTNSSVFNNTSQGINTNSGGIARINNCDIYVNSGTGALVGAGGEIDTWGNNRIFANG